MLKIKQIEPNTGQIPGLPRNPRQINKTRFEKLKKSIVDFPEMLQLREIVVVKHGKIYVCIGGNMRLEAAKELGHTEIPAKVAPSDWPIEKLAEFAIKDNVAFGEDDLDILANEWTEFDLVDYGMDLPDVDNYLPNLDPEMSHRKISADDIIKTQAELDDKFKENNQQLIEVACPHCAETFYINEN